MNSSLMSNQSALLDFQQARRRAIFEHFLSLLTRKSTDLLSYDEVRQKLHARGGSSRGLLDIELKAIVGSVGRYSDFTRSFLPRGSTSSERWTRVKKATTAETGVPPIEVYQIGLVYFVLDGNHRVSVARKMGHTTIQAYVTEVYAKVTLTPEDRPDDLILKSQFAAFLEETRLDKLRPEADLLTSTPGHYRTLIEQIDACRSRLSDGQRGEAAICHWYDNIYLPVIELIREQAILRDFPKRTETDLYVWLLEHVDALKEQLGWEIEHRRAVTHLAAQTSPTQRKVAARVRSKLVDILTPDPLESGPQAGEWRRVQAVANPEDRLARDILVPINGKVHGWAAVDQAMVIAQREDARLRGLYVAPSSVHLNNSVTESIQADFGLRCYEAGVVGELAVEVGDVARTICERAHWADLAVINLSHPPGAQPLARLKSGFRTLLLRSSTPLLIVPEITSKLDHALVAYDGSPKAIEALFLAAYLAERWSMPLVVLSVAERGYDSQAALDEARAYLTSHQVDATYVERDGTVSDAILDATDEFRCNLIMMGGYSRKAIVQAVIGSTLEQVLRNAFQPVLICR